MRDQIVDHIGYWHKRAEFPVYWMLGLIGLTERKFYEWKERYGKANLHNGSIPRDFWLTEQEQAAIVEYAVIRESAGYRRMCYEMMDAGVVAVSPSSVYRVLKKNDLMDRPERPGPTRKGTGFEQPLKAHEHWHTDISFLNICGTFYYLCAILDGYSRKIIGYGVGQTMTEADIELIIEQAKEEYPEARPRIISDNGPQFIARDFKEFIRISGIPMSGQAPIIRKVTARSRDFIGPSRVNRSAKGCRCLSKRQYASSENSSSSTTGFASIVPSDGSPRMTKWPVTKIASGGRGTKNWPMPVLTEPWPDRPRPEPNQVREYFFQSPYRLSSGFEKSMNG